jgi:hypothetical protein
MSGTQGASLEEAYSQGQFIYIPMTKHFAMTRVEFLCNASTEALRARFERRAALLLVH